MEDILQFIISLGVRNITISEFGGQLKVSGNVAALTEEEKQIIRNKKERLLDFLRSNVKSRDKVFAKIKPIEKRADYILSSSQKRLWVLSHFKDSNAAYNIPGAYEFQGVLNIASLQFAVRCLFERHEILRTVFKEDATGEVKQIILPLQEVDHKIRYHDFRDANGKDGLLKHVEEEFSKPFDLVAGPMLRTTLFRVADDKWVFTYVMHHIISDAWSMEILIRELLVIYNSHVNGSDHGLTPLQIQYKDYAVWQHDLLRSDDFLAHKQYWLKQFEGELQLTELPSYKQRPAFKTYNGEAVNKSIDGGLAGAFKALCVKQNGTLFMGLLTLVNTLLYRYTSNEDVTIGTSTATRDHVDLEDQIGFYVNTLALRTKFSGTDSFEALLEKVRKVTLNAYQHQYYPFDDLVEELKLHRDLGRNALFDIMLVLQAANAADSQQVQGLADLSVTTYSDTRTVVSKFDLTFFFTELEEQLHLSIAYNSDIYDARTIEQLASHFEQIMRAVISYPAKPISQVDYLTYDEKKFLEIAGISSSDYPENKTIADLFIERSLRTPDAVALVFEDRALTYRELHERSNKLANYIRENFNVKANDLIGILLDRSEYGIIALLGILKSGAAYVAIDPEIPKARKELIIKDTGIKALITQSDYIFDFTFYDGNIFAIDIQLDGLSTSAENPGTEIKPGHLAYVLYTSGSTGSPKGVMIDHRAVIDYAFGILGKTNISDCKTFGLVSTLAADLGNTVIYTSLLIGGTLKVFSAADVLSPDKMAGADLDCLKIVPSHWRALQQGDALFAPSKCLIFGGEQLTADVIEDLESHKATCHVYNHYGPTETTIGKLINRINISKPPLQIALGSPFGNTEVLILDPSSNLVPLSVPGTICISGDGLAKGYLNNAELTAQKFVKHPFKPGRVIYKTGDLGRWLNDGTVEFISREDKQVKIRGHRVELGEIETRLRDHKDIRSAIVLAKRSANGDNGLVAYLVSSNTLDLSAVKSFLAETLPSYMIPGHFVSLESIPLKANGKVDAAKLLEITHPDTRSGQEYLAPRNETEVALVSIWQDVLSVPVIGIQDNFFDMGGNSLKIVKMVWLINKVLDKKLSVVDAFKFPNIIALSEYLDSAKPYDMGESDIDIEESVSLMENTISLLNTDSDE